VDSAKESIDAEVAKLQTSIDKLRPSSTQP
jgi:hypothetical protein